MLESEKLGEIFVIIEITRWTLSTHAVSPEKKKHERREKIKLKGENNEETEEVRKNERKKKERRKREKFGYHLV